MKNAIYYWIVLLNVISINAQDIYYRPISNLIFANTKKEVLNVGLNYEFRNTQVQAIYALSGKYFVYGTYNIDNSNYTYIPGILGSTRERENNNSGYSFGVGIQKLGAIGNYNNLELLIGYEYQKVNTTENFLNSTDKDYLNQKYYKIFTQFNIIKSKKKFDFGYSLKLAYLKFTDYQYNDYSGFKNKSNIFVDPSLSFNYKMLPQKDLLITSQIGFSAALNNFVLDGGNSTYYFISPILKFGIQYKFALLKNK